MATYRCTVSYVESPDSFYVSPLENQEVWEKILMDIQNPSTSLDLVEVGNICISEQGGLWSRCKIEQVSSNTGEVRVFFIDHGSRETKPVSSLMKLETHRNTPGLVRRVGLAGIQPLQGEVWSDESLETFKELVDIDGGTTFQVTPQTQDKDGYKVIMVDEEGMNMRDVLVELDQARFELEVIESEPRMDEIVSMDRSIVDGDQVIFLNCGDSLNKIYVIKKLDRDHLNGELTTLNLKLEFFPVNLDNIPVLGGYVACPSDNDRIFRGRIENIFTEEMLAEVFLIDEGLNKIISWKELIPIPDGLFSSEGYAQMVLLKDVPSREALQFSREISTLANQEIIYTVHISGDKVILSSQDFNLNTKISAIAYFESKIMDTVGNNFSDLDPGIYEVVLLSNASTSLFYVSTKELINRWIEKISRLTEESLKTESTSKGLKAEPGDLVLVSSGGTWCRALVKKCQDLNIIQVLLVDIGVEDEFSITEIRPLPASLQQERFTSIPCVLQGSENLEPWETENLDVFNRIGFNTELRVEILGKIGWRNIVRFVNL
ncbi:uncharacterized protein LOC111702955 [Eurytemora carolleeae]|uniref:uncharacterized protein LOC111702955 n=1 Tax=Eurytemora carolleeae TaxID=1294199 RepID=UPI000C75878A|nr:uncharacterized protein LOC111702955 [Eurytemora carolleeae]|eukprot:XP_023330550.1 uncharacterized protein LOC111702955 [Eurytemora affinis]